jgi:hypothetical protein
MLNEWLFFFESLVLKREEITKLVDNQSPGYRDKTTLKSTCNARSYDVDSRIFKAFKVVEEKNIIDHW